MHICNWPGCLKMAAYDWWACGDHWRALPARLQYRVRASWRPGIPEAEQPHGYVVTMAEVTAWIKEQFEGDEERKDPGRWARLVRMVRDKDEQRAARRAAEENNDAGAEARSTSTEAESGG